MADDDLRAELAALKARVAALEPKPVVREPVRSWQPPGRDYTEGMGMPANARQAMLDATPDALLRDVSRDRAAQTPTSLVSTEQQRSTPAVWKENTSGWREARPLSEWRK